PLYSGRVLLLPFIEQNALFEQWDPTQAWDSPRNMPISQTALSIFCDPSGDAPSPRTDYLFVVGTGTAFEESMKQNIASLKDGTANTLFMIEAKSTGINWAEPRDFDASQPVPLPPGNHPRVNLGAFFDGSVKAISSDMPPEDVRALATRDGGETVFPN
ncbi:MAG TPA: DUF1559 domain-containing protein, partial [Pirellulaceae bacterium]|nr:DUF1559 domain-containing protein [Pirellulaceae bacterium]